MLGSLLEFGDKLFQDFSWKRIAFLLTLLAIIIACLFIFESYTSYFAITKLDRETSLLQKLSQLSSDTAIDQSTTLAAVRDSLEMSLKRLSSQHPYTDLDSQSTPQLRIFKKAFSASLPWILLGLLILAVSRKNEDKGLTALVGIIFFSIPFAAIGAIIPFWNAPANYIGYPLGSFTFGIAAVLFFNKLNNISKAKIKS